MVKIKLEVCMQKYIFLTIAILILGMTVASAHPASLVNATFDKDKGNLVVTFAHKVSAPASHYISQIKVQLNKKDVIVQNNLSQETDAGGTFYYKLIGVKVGDKIKVTTVCNKIGNKSAEIVVK